VEKKYVNKTGNAELLAARNASSRLFLVTFLFSIFVNLLMLTGPFFMLLIYDRVLASGSQETLTALFILVIALYSIYGLLEFARGRVMARVGARFQDQLDNRVFKATLDNKVKDIHAKKTNVSTLRHLEAIQNFFASPIFLALCDIPWSPIFFAAIFFFHHLLGIFALCGAFILLSITVLNQYLSKRKQAEAFQTIDIAEQKALEAIDGADIIQSQGMSSIITDRWQANRRMSLDMNVKAQDINGFFTSTTKALRLFLQSAMLALGAYLVLKSEISAGA